MRHEAGGRGGGRRCGKEDRGGVPRQGEPGACPVGGLPRPPPPRPALVPRRAPRAAARQPATGGARRGVGGRSRGPAAAHACERREAAPRGPPCVAAPAVRPACARSRSIMGLALSTVSTCFSCTPGGGRGRRRGRAARRGAARGRRAAERAGPRAAPAAGSCSPSPPPASACLTLLDARHQRVLVPRADVRAWRGGGRRGAESAARRRRGARGAAGSRRSRGAATSPRPPHGPLGLRSIASLPPPADAPAEGARRAPICAPSRSRVEMGATPARPPAPARGSRPEPARASHWGRSWARTRRGPARRAAAPAPCPPRCP
jgi:hypothetical protein